MWLLLVACSGHFTGDDTGAPDDTTTDTRSLDDITATLDPGGCEEVEGQAHPGAASYFAGLYHHDSDGWTAAERWVLFANQAWQDVGGRDCVVSWTIVATEQSVGACAACGLGLGVAATVDPDTTTCPEDLYTGDENFQTAYDVLRDQGAATWYYSSTGTLLGAGQDLGDDIDFVTQRSCAWF